MALEEAVAAALKAGNSVDGGSQTQGFDFVIVGAGTAGCVVASRLCQLTNASVLIIEAGAQTDDPVLHSSVNWERALFSPWVLNWTTTAQKAAGDRITFAPRGRVVGGSSAVNALYHNWASQADFDDWGLEGWRWNDIAPSFTSIETYMGKGQAHRGIHGAIGVTRIDDGGNYSQRLFDAARACGHDVLDDINTPGALGVGAQQIAYHQGKRQHTGDVFLMPLLGKDINLTCWTETLVTKLLTQSGKVTGLEVRTPEGDTTIQANVAVILCGGAVQSPQLLMLSGIGPADHLASVGIDCISDLPGVGGNLHDHYLVMASIYGAKVPIDQSALHQSVASLYASTQGKSGPRDLMVNFFSNGTAYPPVPSPDPGFKSVFAAMRPKSRGTLRLSNAEPDAMPLIDPGFLNEPADMDATIMAYELSEEIFASAPFDEIRGDHVWPAKKTKRADIEAFIRASGVGYAHLAGTCKLGEDDQSVINTNGMVKGFDNLFVVDCSIMPDIVSAPTNPSVAAMAHHMAPRMLQALAL